ncbi:MAG: 50S ribosomal protein L30 [Chloroflexia bacterium]|nr:50S ribosomal protein L30 [Chloroflexia bacterium]
MSSSGAFRAARAAASETASSEGMLSITLVRSTIGRPGDQGRTVEALGLRRLHQTVVRPDHPSIRGMVAKVSHLVRVEEIARPGTSPS